MRAVLKLELIGDDFFFYRRTKTKSPEQLWQMARRLGFNESPSWAARLKLIDGKLKREFLRPTKDYSQANSTGSRGIFAYYVLQPRGIYEVNDRYTWKRVHHYYCQIEETKIIEISRQEAIDWLKNNS